MLDKTELIVMKVVELLKYEKSNGEYLDRPKLQKYVVNKALTIPKVLYLGYLLLFLLIIQPVILCLYKIHYV